MNGVVITGYGFVAGLGETADELFEALVSTSRAGESQIDTTQVSDEILKSNLKGRNLRPLDRTSRMLSVAVAHALTDGRFNSQSEQDIGLVSGTMFASAATIAAFDCRAMEEGPAYASALDFANSVINASTGQTAIWHGLRGENTTIATGQSSGLKAIARASSSIRTGREKVLLAGGVEELSDASFRAFNDSGLLTDQKAAVPFGNHRDGFRFTEGAAIVLLESATHANGRGANVVADVLGSGTSFDSMNRASESDSVESIERAMSCALRNAGVGPDDVDVVVCSANGSVVTDHHEMLALDRIFISDAKPVRFTPKGAIGESVGAAGPLQLIAVLECIRRGRIPGAESPDANRRPSTTVLVNSISFDGHSCSVVIRSRGSVEWN